jgi:ribosomal-protein-alanine N-acetyltransferase
MPCSGAEDRERQAPLPGVRFAPMTTGDLQQVLDIEGVSFRSPWRKEHFRFEIRDNRHALNRVARLDDGRVLGYLCAWVLPPELKINNIAVHPGFRRRGIGRWLLRCVLEEASRAGCTTAALEVRPSNRAARHLYRDHGFVEVGRRKAYYREEGEDAILMEASLVDCQRGEGWL